MTLEIFQVVHLKKQKKKELPMQTSQTTLLASTTRTQLCENEALKLLRITSIFKCFCVTYHSSVSKKRDLNKTLTTAYCLMAPWDSFLSEKNLLKSRWILHKSVSQKGPTTFLDRQASPSSTSVSSVLLPAMKNLISSTT